MLHNSICSGTLPTKKLHIFCIVFAGKGCHTCKAAYIFEHWVGFKQALGTMEETAHSDMGRPAYNKGSMNKSERKIKAPFTFCVFMVKYPKTSFGK